jgi:hypothetical protein
MAKNTVKVTGNTISGTAEDITKHLQKGIDKLKGENAGPKIEIRGATLKSAFCNYIYELKTGVTSGDEIKRTGAAVVHNDLPAAFANLDVHLGMICEEIDISEIDFDNLPPRDEESIKKLKGKEKELALLIASFHVNQFKIEGTGENEGVILIGTKTLSTGDQLKLETPKVKWSDNYEPMNELMSALTTCKNEVEEYSNGKAAPKLVQTDMFEGDGEPEDRIE